MKPALPLYRCPQQVALAVSVIVGCVMLGWPVGGVASARAAEKLPGRVISVLRNFEPEEGIADRTGPTSGSHADFRNSSGKREYSDDTPYGRRCWKLTVDNPVDFSGWKKAGWDKIDKIYLVELLKIPHFPPEADAVRLRCKVLRGSFKLSVGGPVIQSGTSDVFTVPVEVTAENCAEWRTLDLSLNHGLMRNFRRARYSKDSPVIYQTRWGQEDFSLVGMKESGGVILIDQIELIALGEGRPFPEFKPGEVKRVALVADFEDDGDLKKVASIMHGYDSGQGQQDEFEQSWRRDPLKPKVKREPVKYALAPGGKVGRRSLATSAHFEEEHSFALIKMAGEPRANALQLIMKARGRNPDLSRGAQKYWGMAIDFLVLVASPGQPFPWPALEPSAELRQGPGPGYEYQISLSRLAGVSYGYYHARRLLPQDTWTPLVIPFADFVCGYGQGEFAESFRGQLPLDGAKIVGLMYVGPIRFDLEIMLDEIAYVHVPGTTAELRSFWQVPDVLSFPLTKHTWLLGPGVQSVRR